MKVKFLKLTVILGLLVISHTSFSQTNNDSIQKTKVDSVEKIEKKLKFGSGFGLNFVGGTNINISPNLTYSVSKKVAFGLGLQFNYLAIKDLQKTTTYGVNTIFKFNPSQKITTLLEFVQLRVSSKLEIDDSKRTFWDSALFAGVGLNVTKKISVGAKYNFLYKEDESIYSSPVIPFVNISF